MRYRIASSSRDTPEDHSLGNYSETFEGHDGTPKQASNSWFPPDRNCTEPLIVTVWLDAKTKRPLKREIILKQNQQAITLTETYSTLALDEKVDEGQFELPKP